MKKALRIIFWALAGLTALWLLILYSDPEYGMRLVKAPARFIKVVKLRAAIPRLEVPEGMRRYQYKIERVYAEAYQPGVIFRVLSKARGAGVIFIDSAGRLVALDVGYPTIWDHESRQTLLENFSLTQWEEIEKWYSNVPLDLADYKVKRAERILPADLKAAIIAVWVDALAHARREPAGVAIDGVNYVYSVKMPDGLVKTAETWSPDEGTLPDALANIQYALEDYVRGTDKGREGRTVESAIEDYWRKAAQRSAHSEELDSVR